MIFKHKLKKPSSKYILSASVADLLVGLFVIPTGIPEVGKALSIVTFCWFWFHFKAIDDYPHDFESCMVVQVSALIIFIASLTSVLALTIDRFCAIFSPISYRHQSRNRATRVILLSWLFPVLMILPVLFDENVRERFENKCILTTIVNYDVMLLHSYIAVCAFTIMIAIYSFIFCNIYKQVKSTLNSV